MEIEKLIKEAVLESLADFGELSPPNKMTFGEMQALYDAADRAGMEAANAKVPVPMIVQERADPFDDNSPVVKEYEPIMDGVCGFAWIVVKPGNSRFARFLKAQGYATPSSYEGGVKIWVSQFNQSCEKKSAYAAAFAKVLTDAGIRAYSDSRLD